MAGKKKYSKVKLLLFDSLKNVRKGYLIKPLSTTNNPTSHVIICLNKKATCASRTLFFGIKIKSKIDMIIHEEISIFFLCDMPHYHPYYGKFLPR
jgi:hypothetical protein